MSNKDFVRSMRDIASLGNKVVTVAKDDFNELLRIADLGARVTSHACTCTSDQYGHATDPQCILHGEESRSEK